MSDLRPPPAARGDTVPCAGDGAPASGADMSALDRRRFLFVTGATAAGVAVAGGLGATGVLLWPPVSYEAPRRYAIGRPEALPAGRTAFLPDRRIYVINTPEGVGAISAVCTHLGCTVRHVEGEGFSCPCHGSRFDVAGQVIDGPAPRPLAWYGVSLSRRGELVVDERRVVDPTRRFRV
jgi:cytochrome b6-f complex iron-sulfur subunit